MTMLIKKIFLDFLMAISSSILGFFIKITIKSSISNLWTIGHKNIAKTPIFFLIRLLDH